MKVEFCIYLSLPSQTILLTHQEIPGKAELCHHAWIVFQVPRFCALNPLLFHFTAVCVFLLLLFIS